jgi:hypothetical protein
MSHKQFLIAIQRLAFGWEVVTEYRFHPTRRWRFGFAIPSLKIAVEVRRWRVDERTPHTRNWLPARHGEVPTPRESCVAEVEVADPLPRLTEYSK